MSFKNMLVESWKLKQLSEEKDHGTHPHDKEDEKEDVKLIKKVVKKDCIKTEELTVEDIWSLTESECDEVILEVLSKDASAGDWIHDFVHSKNPKFVGKSKAKRRQMALAAYYGKQNEEIDVNDRTKDELGGRTKTKQKDDVGPASDGKTTKVRFHAGPKNEETEVETQKLTDETPPTVVKSKKPEPRSDEDLRAKEGRVKQGMKEEADQLDEKNWIAGAIKHPGTETAAAKKAGMSVQDYAHKHAHDSGTSGKRARLAITLKKMHSEEEQNMAEVLESIGLKSKIKAFGKKALEKLGHGDDESMRKDLQRKMGVPETGKPAHAKHNEEVELDEGSAAELNARANAYMNRDKAKQANAKQKQQDAETIKKHKFAYPKPTKEETESVEEGWDDMVADTRKRMGSGPQPSGGEGKKQGTRYGGGKQTSKPEHDEDDEPKKKVSEGKDPTMDAGCGSTPDFASNSDNKPLAIAKHLAKKASQRLKKDLKGE